MRNNKRGISEMLAYTILIVIAISLSLLVYSWLKIYALKPTVECNEDTSLIIEGYECDLNNYRINLTVRNQGKFIIDGFSAKGSNLTGRPPVYSLREVRNPLMEEIFFNPPLNVSESRLISLNFAELEKLVSIQVQPYMEKDKKIVFCKNAVYTQDLQDCG